MQDTIRDIEQFVASVAIGVGLVTCAACFLMAGFITRNRRHSEQRRLRGLFSAAEREARDLDIAAAYEDGRILANTCHACNEHPIEHDASYLCSICRGLGIDLCKRCNDWSLLDENDECPSCAIATSARPAGNYAEPVVVPTVFPVDDDGHELRNPFTEDTADMHGGPTFQKLSKPPRYDELMAELRAKAPQAARTPEGRWAITYGRCPQCGGLRECQTPQYCLMEGTHPCHRCNGSGVVCICKVKPHPANRLCPIHGGEDSQA